jgi:hypothetical protein
VDCYIIREFYIDHIFILGIQMLLIVTPQKLNQSIFDYFCLPIYTWMQWCTPIEISVHLLPQCSPKSIEKSSVPIRDDAPWYPKENLDLFKEEFCCLLSLDGIFTRNANAHFVELVKYHK